jgi:hypothetical protein
VAKAAERVDDLERRTGMTRRELEVYDPETLDRWRQAALDAELDDETVWRIRRVRRLHRQLGLDYESIEIILRLVDRLEQLEAGRERSTIIVRVLDQ